jgi:hypothetical protein
LGVVGETIMNSERHESLTFKYLINSLHENSDGGQKLSEDEESRLNDYVNNEDLHKETMQGIVDAVQTQDSHGILTPKEVEDIVQRYEQGYDYMRCLSDYSYHLGVHPLFSQSLEETPSHIDFAMLVSQFDQKCEALEERTGIRLLRYLNCFSENKEVTPLGRDRFVSKIHPILTDEVISRVLSGEFDELLSIWHSQYQIERISVGCVREIIGINHLNESFGYGKNEDINKDKPQLRESVSTYAALVRDFPSHDSVLKFVYDASESENSITLSQEQKEAFYELAEGFESSSDLYLLFEQDKMLLNRRSDLQRIRQLLPEYYSNESVFSVSGLISALDYLNKIEDVDWHTLETHRSLLEEYLGAGENRYIHADYMKALSELFLEKDNPLILKYFPYGLSIVRFSGDYITIEEILEKYDSHEVWTRTQELPVNSLVFSYSESPHYMLSAFFEIIKSNEGFSVIKSLVDNQSESYITKILLVFHELDEFAYEDKIAMLGEYVHLYPHITYNNLPFSTYHQYVLNDEDKKQFLQDFAPYYSLRLFKLERMGWEQWCKLDESLLASLFQMRHLWLDEDFLWYMSLFKERFNLNIHEMMSMAERLCLEGYDKELKYATLGVDLMLEKLSAFDAFEKPDSLQVCYDWFLCLPSIREEGVELLSHLEKNGCFESHLDFMSFLLFVPNLQQNECLLSKIQTSQGLAETFQHVDDLKLIYSREKFKGSFMSYGVPNDRFSKEECVNRFFLDASYLPEETSLSEIYLVLKIYTSSGSDLVSLDDLIYFAHHPEEYQVLQDPEFASFHANIIELFNRFHVNIPIPARDLLYLVRIYQMDDQMVVKKLKKKRVMKSLLAFNSLAYPAEARSSLISLDVLYCFLRYPQRVSMTDFEAFISDNYSKGLEIDQTRLCLELWIIFYYINNNEELKEIFANITQNNTASVEELFEACGSKKQREDNEQELIYEVDFLEELPPYLKLKVYLLLRGLQEDPLLREQIRLSLYKDVFDETTEVAGVLSFDPQTMSFSLQHRESMPRANSNYAPYDPDVFTSPFFFHHHAMSLEEGLFSGPSLGDLFMAEKLGFNALVVTSLDKNRFNVDLFGPMYALDVPESQKSRHQGYCFDLGIYTD